MTGVGGGLKKVVGGSAFLGGLVFVGGLFSSLDIAALASEQRLPPARLAVTIDDLPETGSATPGVSREEIAHLVIKALKANGIEAYGFANGAFLKNRPQESAILKDWMAADFPLGNHTRDHLDLRASDPAAYIDNIEAEARLLSALTTLGSGATAAQPIFRYPYL